MRGNPFLGRRSFSMLGRRRLTQVLGWLLIGWITVTTLLMWIGCSGPAGPGPSSLPYTIVLNCWRVDSIRFSVNMVGLYGDVYGVAHGSIPNRDSLTVRLPHDSTTLYYVAHATVYLIDTPAQGIDWQVGFYGSGWPSFHPRDMLACQ